MYERLDEKTKKELRSKYEKQQEYMVAYNAINVVSEQYEDLEPEEIWDEALLVIDEISKSNCKIWKVDKVYSQLIRKYHEFKKEDGSIQKRTEGQQEKTATMVLFDVVLMLTLAQKVEPEKAGEHPYYTYITSILQHIGHTILFEAMLAVTKQGEEETESITGKELEQLEYLEGVPEQKAEDVTNDLSDDKVRRAKLKKVKLELENQLGEKFKGGSQWFYVYKLMVERSTYKDHSYAQFVEDMKSESIKTPVNTNTFTRKYKQLKEGLYYPYWKTKSGGKLTQMEEGLKIAKIALKVLYQ